MRTAVIVTVVVLVASLGMMLWMHRRAAAASTPLPAAPSEQQLLIGNPAHTHPGAGTMRPFELQEPDNLCLL